MKKALDFIYTKPEYFEKLNIAKFENTHRLLIATLMSHLDYARAKSALAGTN